MFISVPRKNILRSAIFFYFVICGTEIDLLNKYHNLYNFSFYFLCVELYIKFYTLKPNNINLSFIRSILYIISFIISSYTKYIII